MTRRCVLPRRLLTLIGIVALLPAVVAAPVSRTVLLYGTSSLSLRGGLPIPIGSACPPRTIAAGGVESALLSSALVTAPAFAASPSRTRSPTPTGRENVSLLRVRGSSSVDGPSHKEVGRVLVVWSERGWKKSRFGKKGSLRVTTGGSCLWDKQLKGCTERLVMSGLTSQTTIHLQARMYRHRVRGPETPEPLHYPYLFLQNLCP